MKYINKIIKPIVTLISNIKYLFSSDLKTRLDNHSIRMHSTASKVSRIFDNIDIDTIDDRIYSLESSLDDVQNDVEDKCNEYQVEDLIYNLMGNSEDYVNCDDMNDIKDDIKHINNKLKSYIETYEDLMEHLKNGGFSDELTDSYRELATHKVIEELIFRLSNGDEHGELEKRLDGVLENVTKELEYSKSLNKKMIDKLNNV